MISKNVIFEVIEMAKKFLTISLISAGLSAVAAGVYLFLKRKENSADENYSIDNGQELDLSSDPFFNKDLPHIKHQTIPGQAEMEVKNYTYSSTTPADRMPSKTSHAD